MPVVSCPSPPPQPVFGIVEFSAAEFLASYPEFTGINSAAPAVLGNDFVGATFLLNNGCCSRVCDANQRLYLLYLLTAHIATIFQGLNDGGIGAPLQVFTGSVDTTGLLTVTSPASGLLAVGSSLYDGPSVGGAFLPPGTLISALRTGTGGAGTYQLNYVPSVAIASETMLVPGVPNVQAPLGVVGRISDAAEGDVSVSAQWEAPPNANQAYFTQTKYGAQYWTMTARYRTALFVPAPADAYNPLAGLGGRWPGPGNGY